MTARTLVIMRHGKAEQTESGADIDRPLTTRGRDDATAAGAWLASHGLVPDVVLCSPAARARATWHGVAVGLANQNPAIGTSELAAPSVRYERGLYDGGVAVALELIRGVDPDAATVLLVGHNPTVSALSVRLDDRRTRAAGGLRTSGLAVHTVETAWADCATAPLTTGVTARS
jgi:phosphohistidine phosphatase